MKASNLNLINCINLLILILCYYISACSNNSDISSFTPSVYTNKHNKSISNSMIIVQPKIHNTDNTNKHITVLILATHKKIKHIKPIHNTITHLSSMHIKNNNIYYYHQYNNFPQNRYTEGNMYIVKKGDTLFHIAWITGNNFQDLAQCNNIKDPYNLNIGQVLYIGKVKKTSLSPNKIVALTHAIKHDDSIKYIHKKNILITSYPNHSSINKLQISKHITFCRSHISTNNIITSTTVPAIHSTTLHINSNKYILTPNIPSFIWQWPTKGKLIRDIPHYKTMNKGINIAGNKGQAIVASADGRVVYTGNAVRGYGNLIIIKHKNNYLSAYAHNDMILVQEQQEVKAQDKIATMGSTGTSSTRLYFEIRYKGESVDPLKYLPKR